MNMSEWRLAVLKNILFEELGSDCDVEKTPAFLELVKLIGELTMPVFPEILDDGTLKQEWSDAEKQDFYEAASKVCEELGVPTELAAYLRDNKEKMSISFKENCRNIIRWVATQKLRNCRNKIGWARACPY